jgi:hypothetical protein
MTGIGLADEYVGGSIVLAKKGRTISEEPDIGKGVARYPANTGRRLGFTPLLESSTL